MEGDRTFRGVSSPSDTSEQRIPSHSSHVPVPFLWRPGGVLCAERCRERGRCGHCGSCRAQLRGTAEDEPGLRASPAPSQEPLETSVPYPEPLLGWVVGPSAWCIPSWGLCWGVGSGVAVGRGPASLLAGGHSAGRDLNCKGPVQPGGVRAGRGDSPGSLSETEFAAVP